MPETSFRNCGEAIHHKLNLTGSISLASPALFFKKKKKRFINFIFGHGGSSWLGGLFSSCSEWELLFVVVRGLLAVACLVAEHGL